MGLPEMKCFLTSLGGKRDVVQGFLTELRLNVQVAVFDPCVVIPQDVDGALGVGGEGQGRFLRDGTVRGGNQ